MTQPATLPPDADAAFAMVLCDAGVLPPRTELRTTAVSGDPAGGLSFWWNTDEEEGTGHALRLEGGWFCSPAPVRREDLAAAVAALPGGASGLRPLRTSWPGEKRAGWSDAAHPLIVILGRSLASGAERYVVGLDPGRGATILERIADTSSPASSARPGPAADPLLPRPGKAKAFDVHDHAKLGAGSPEATARNVLACPLDVLEGHVGERLYLGDLVLVSDYRGTGALVVGTRPGEDGRPRLAIGVPSFDETEYYATIPPEISYPSVVPSLSHWDEYHVGAIPLDGDFCRRVLAGDADTVEIEGCEFPVDEDVAAALDDASMQIYALNPEHDPRIISVIRERAALSFKPPEDDAGLR